MALSFGSNETVDDHHRTVRVVVGGEVAARATEPLLLPLRRLWWTDDVVILPRWGAGDAPSSAQQRPSTHGPRRNRRW